MRTTRWTHTRWARRLAVLAAGFAVATTAVTITSASPASASPATTAVSVSYTSHCGEPPVPDTPINDGPEGMFGTPCLHHDQCYSRGTTHNRLDCDLRFLNEMYSACNAHYGWWDPRRGWCQTLAYGYYLAVRNFGWAYYQGPWYWNF
jgi:hypothetical protein